MESGGTGQSEMRATNLRFVAQCRGNRFDVSLRALKGYYGLLACPYALVKGDRLVLNPVDAGVTPAFARLQLFARIIMPHPERSLYETVWEKLVSPTGLTVLMEYMQSNLGVCIASSPLHDSPWVDQELAYFDFATATVNYPGRGQCPAQRVDAVPYSAPVASIPDPGFGSTQPPRRNPLLTPSSPVRSGSMVPQSAPPVSQRPVAPLPPKNEGRSMYGMDVSGEELDLADLISTRQGAGRSGQSGSNPQSPADGAAGAPKESLRGSVTSLIRSLANHMSDDSPFDDDRKKR